jgi:peptidoglycan L-alanyl-D-glutamate endopeptidase CwlK
MRFGPASLAIRATLNTDLIRLVDDVIAFVPPRFDFSLVCGYRDRGAQEKAFREGKSKKQWPDSKHNVRPSLAVDVSPFPADYADDLRIARLIGIFDARAIELGIAIRCGLDFSGDGRSRDEKFVDAWHIELA